MMLVTLEEESPLHPLQCIVFLPGNVYPVIEDINGQQSLKGVPMKTGHNSHFVVTNQRGNCVTSDVDQELFNEIVVPQEGQIVPAFLIELAGSQVDKLISEWNISTLQFR